MRHLFEEIPYLENPRIILKKVEEGDTLALRELTQNVKVYQYLPAFLFEKKYADTRTAIGQMYEEPFKNKESLFLGIYVKDGTGEKKLCGLAELYGYREDIHKVSLGYRLSESCWGRGIATEVVGLLVEYLYEETEIEIITATTMVENRASNRVLEKNGFIQNVSMMEEDWGYSHMILVDKWFR